MRVQNEKIIKAWAQGRKATSPVRDIDTGVYTERGASVSTDGKKIFSYWTPIAWWGKSGQLVVDMKKYSYTTTRLQSDILEYAKKELGVVVEVA